MKNIHPRAWAHTPRDTITRTDHLLDAWGDIFCSLKVGARLGITFARFIEMPPYHLRRLRARSANFRDDRRLDLWGDIFCKHEVYERLGITFKLFLATPNYYLTRAMIIAPTTPTVVPAKAGIQLNM